MEKDCFAFSGKDKGVPRCTALNEMLCAQEGKCAFFKTKEQAIEDRAKATARAKEMGYYADGAEYAQKH